MANKYRHHSKAEKVEKLRGVSNCSNKYYYVTAEFAVTKCQLMADKYHKQVWAYKCPSCRGYHLTTSEPFADMVGTARPRNSNAW